MTQPLVVPWPLRLFVAGVLGTTAITCLLVVLGSPVFLETCGGPKTRAEMQVANLATAVQHHRLTQGALPPSLEALTKAPPGQDEAFIDRLPTDPWGRPYRYRPLPEDRFRLWSAGPDGLDGTADDVAWSPYEPHADDASSPAGGGPPPSATGEDRGAR